MSKQHLQTIEINGIKMEVDLRTAKRVDCFKVGDRVKLLRKEQYSSSPTIHHGVIVGFDNFEKAPTIVVSYLENGYNPEIKIAHINALQSENTVFEVIADNDHTLPIAKTDVLSVFDREVNKKLEEIREQYRKKRYFLSRFGKMFGETRDEIAAQLEATRNEEKALMETIANENAATAE
jgi:hypothetical protein